MVRGNLSYNYEIAQPVPSKARNLFIPRNDTLLNAFVLISSLEGYKLFKKPKTILYLLKG
jgi:hypothetical protein